jgi:murein L,D-transpeptidase YafK
MFRVSKWFILLLVGLSLLSIIGLLAVKLTPASSERSETAINRWTPYLEQTLAEKSLTLGSEVFLRLTKVTSPEDRRGYLEAFVRWEEGDFLLYKRWPICTYSGKLGPKLKEGDGQSPEGFYFVTPRQMNPNSTYHLSFNLGFPNIYDRSHNRTGSFLMVHGNCVSIGCYAMTNEGIEEIYTLMSAAYDGGQDFIHVHIFPFPMTEENMATYENNPNIQFWKNLKSGWDKFEKDNRPPDVSVENRRYVFTER